MRRGRELSIAVVLAAAVWAAGCGNERTLTASEFVDQVNEQGVELTLGPQQPVSEGGPDHLYHVSLAPLPGLPPPAPGVEDEPGAKGSLYVFSDNDAAEDQMTACRNSGGLVCFRASNLVVVFEQGGLEEQRLGVAIQKMGQG